MQLFSGALESGRGSDEHRVFRGDSGATPPFVAFDRNDSIKEGEKEHFLERLKWFARSHCGASRGSGSQERFHVLLVGSYPKFLSTQQLVRWVIPAMRASGLVS